MKSAIKMMIGSGMPISQSNSPRPRPMMFSYCFQLHNAKQFGEVPREDGRVHATSKSAGQTPPYVP
jgi:hypothetical protein